MENPFYGTKDLYSVVLKSTYPMEVGNLHFQQGEVIAKFDSIQIGGLDTIKTSVSARGGYNNPALVVWDKVKEIQLNFTQGVFSKTQLAILTNSNLIQKNQLQLPINYSEDLTVENGQITLKYAPIDEVIIYYMDGELKKTTGRANNKIVTTTLTDGTEVNVNYNFMYSGDSEIFSIGNNLTNGFLALEGHMRLKDDNTGHTVTGILKIPKLKLMSGLSMRFGREASPLVTNFNAICYPDGPRGQEEICNLYILPEDIDSDF